jgi:hypothetical protein
MEVVCCFVCKPQRCFGFGTRCLGSKPSDVLQLDWSVYSPVERRATGSHEHKHTIVARRCPVRATVRMT